MSSEKISFGQEELDKKLTQKNRNSKKKIDTKKTTYLQIQVINFKDMCEQMPNGIISDFQTTVQSPLCVVLT